MVAFCRHACTVYLLEQVSSELMEEVLQVLFGTISGEW